MHRFTWFCPFRVPQISPCFKRYSSHIRGESKIIVVKDSKYQKVVSTFESLNYDKIQDELTKEEEIAFGIAINLALTIQRNIVICFVAISMALCVMIINVAEHKYLDLKISFLLNQFKVYFAKPQWKLLFPLIPMWILFTSVPALLSSLFFVIAEPDSTTAGLPGIIGFLNGIQFPRVVSFKLLIYKMISTIFMLMAGIVTDKEGPIMHLGVILGILVSMMRIPFKNVMCFKLLQNDRERRDIASVGIAAGVCAAFIAPIGGVILAIEEGISYRSKALTTKILLGSLITSFTSATLKSILVHQCAGCVLEKNLLFLADIENRETFMEYRFFEIPFFIIIGILGGLTGSAWNCLEEQISYWRQKYIKKNSLKILEVVVVSSVAAVISFIILFSVTECNRGGLKERHFVRRIKAILTFTLGAVVFLFQPFLRRYVPLAIHSFTLAVRREPMPFSYIRQYISLLKEVGWDLSLYLLASGCSKFYATFLQKEGTLSASFIHFKTGVSFAGLLQVMAQVVPLWKRLMGVKPLIVLLIYYFILSAIYMGATVSGGIFVPNIITGAIWGRLLAELLLELAPDTNTWCRPQMYAFLAAGAHIGGTTRICLSIGVIMLESSGQIAFGLPVFIVVITTKFIADIFTHCHPALTPTKGKYLQPCRIRSILFARLRTRSVIANHFSFPSLEVIVITACFLLHPLRPIYHSECMMKGMPLLERTVPPYCSWIPVRNIMNKNVVALPKVTTVGAIVNVLKNTKHNGFPVVDPNFISEEDDFESYGQLLGLVLRINLITILKHKLYALETFEENLNVLRNQFIRGEMDFELQDIKLLKGEQDKTVDLDRFMHISPFFVQTETSFTTVYALMTGLGMRHLLVVNQSNEVVGVVTRKDIAVYKSEITCCSVATKVVPLVDE